MTYDFPYPLDSGGKTRAYNLIKFAGSKMEISLLSFVRQEPTKEELDKLHNIGVKNIHTIKRNSKRDIKSVLGVFTKNSIFKNLYYDSKIEKKIQQIISEDQVDIVHFESYYTGFYIGEELRKKGIKQVLGTENIEHQLYDLYTEKNAAFLTRPVLRREVNKIKKEEIKMIQEADCTLAVTKSECDYIEKNGGKNCTVIENGVDIDYFAHTQKLQNPQKLLFIGNFSYFPNIDAMEYFYYEIFPKLPKDIEITVLGKGYKALDITDKRIKFIEYVEDIREVHKDAFAMVSPIRIGGGTNFKILESMAARTAVIADPSRIPYVGARIGSEIFQASSADEFVDKIIMLRGSRVVRAEVEENAFEFVKNNYSWKNIGEKLNNVWEKT